MYSVCFYFSSWYGVCYVQICIFVLIQIQCKFNDFSAFRYLSFVISIVDFVIKLFYDIKSDVVCMFVDSSFLIFSEFKFVIILIDVIYKFK
jgi:hypothetical protein